VLIRVVPMIALVRAVRRGTWQDVSALRLGLATFVAVLFTIWPWPSPAQVASPVTTPPTWLTLLQTILDVLAAPLFVWGVACDLVIAYWLVGIAARLLRWAVID
jgi:hypothetical protein